MDVRLLSGMIGDLMLQADSLSLPGLGTFVAEDMPASFSDRGYSVNPPYRRITFTSRQTQDNMLAALYSASNEGLSQEDAASIIGGFCATLLEELNATKSVDLPGLGRLRATREGQLFFVPDPDLDISPDACGLATVSLKTHSAAAPVLPDFSFTAPPAPTPAPAPAEPAISGAEEPETLPIEEENAEIGAQEPQTLPIEEEPVESGAEEPQTLPKDNSADAAEEDSVRDPLTLTNRVPDDIIRSEEPEPQEPEPQPEEPEPQTEQPEPTVEKPEPKHTVADHNTKNKVILWAVAIACVVAILLIAFVIVSRIYPEFTDKLLYTPEQLELLNTPIDDGTGLPG